MSLFLLKRREAIVLSAALACFAPIAFAGPIALDASSAPVAAGAPLKVPALKFEKYTLPNGLEVILREDHRLPLVAVDLWYHVGPVNEKAGRTGFAHLFEHMMFEGSEHVGEKAHIKYVEGAGATDINGTTSYDRTNYFETVPSNEVDLALWLESDRMGFLLETLDRTKLANQRDVVRNELRQDEGEPYDVADEAQGHLLFPKGHPYYGNVIGSHADVEAARLLDVRDFFHTYYTPNNASIAIVGDFNAAEMKAKVEKYFGPIPAGPKVDKVSVVTPPITSERRATVTDTVQLPRLSVAWLAPEAFHPGDADADVFLSVLGGGKTSRLYQKLVYETQVAQSVGCSDDSMMVTSIAHCEITARPGVKLEALEAAFDKEVEALRKDGPTAVELERVRNQSLSGLIEGLQRLGGFGGVADMMNRYNQYKGDPGYLPEDVARYEAATPATVKKIAQDVFGKNQRVVIYCVPGEKKTEDVARSPENTDADVKVIPPYSAAFEKAQEWRKDAPKPGPDPTLHLPTPKMFALNNGMKVYLIEEHSLPVFSAALVSMAGGEKNPSGKPGLAAFTAQMLGEGTATRSSTQLANDVAQIGAGLGAQAGTDQAFASISSLSNNSGPSMELLSDVVLHPAFKDEEVERIRQQRLVAIQQEADSPDALVFRVGAKALYGDQPYGYESVGTPGSVKAITKGDMSAFWNAHYAAGDSALIMAGDVSESEAKRLAEKYFGGWSGTGSAGESMVPLAPAPPSRRVILVDKPGSPQTALFGFGLGVPRNTPDYAAVSEMNSILGGLFASRINMNLREKNGFTYGATSGFAFHRGGGPFYAGAQVRTDITGPAAKELFTELNRIHTDPATPEELKLAKDNALRSLPGQFATVGDEIGLMGELYVYSLPLDYFEKLPAEFEAVTPEAVAKAAKDYVHPENLIVIAVGDKAKIQGELEKLNLGPMEQRDESGELVKK
jgi:zinc protease